MSGPYSEYATAGREMPDDPPEVFVSNDDDNPVFVESTPGETEIRARAAAVQAAAAFAGAAYAAGEATAESADNALKSMFALADLLTTYVLTGEKP